MDEIEYLSITIIVHEGEIGYDVSGEYVIQGQAIDGSVVAKFVEGEMAGKFFLLTGVEYEG